MFIYVFSLVKSPLFQLPSLTQRNVCALSSVRFWQFIQRNVERLKLREREDTVEKQEVSLGAFVSNGKKLVRFISKKLSQSWNNISLTVITRKNTKILYVGTLQKMKNPKAENSILNYNERRTSVNSFINPIIQLIQHYMSTGNEEACILEKQLVYWLYHQTLGAYYEFLFQYHSSFSMNIYLGFQNWNRNRQTEFWLKFFLQRSKAGLYFLPYIFQVVCHFLYLPNDPSKIHKNVIWDLAQIHFRISELFLLFCFE